MQKKKILIVSNTFYPKNSPRSFRTTELAKEFAKKGHEVTVLIPKTEEAVLFASKHNISVLDLGRRKFKPIRLKPFGQKTIYFFNKILRRLLLLLVEFPNLEIAFQVSKVLLKEKEYDILISIAAPHTIHWGVALALRKKKDITSLWIADCGDPYMGVTTDSFKKLFYFKYVEKFWCKKADFITVPIKGAKKGYYDEFRNKIKIIPQGFNFQDILINTDDYQPNSVITFAYAGLLIPGARDPKPFIKYLLSLNIDFKFVVYTQSKNILSDFFGNANIEIRDYVPRSDLLLSLSKMDFLINFNNGVTTQLPSKLIDYFLTKRPVLSLDSYSFDKKIVLEFLEGNYINKFEYLNPEQYRIESVAAQFLELYN